MKHSIFKKSALILVGLFAISFFSLQAQKQSGVFGIEDTVRERLETIQAKLNLSGSQLAEIKAIDAETEARLEAAANNTAARRVYEWRDAQYKKVLSAEQFRTFLKERQAIVDAAQAAWSATNGTPVEV
jgi:hypothetical protein